MYALLATLIASVAIVPLLLHWLSPYFIQDFRYFIIVVRKSFEVKSYARSVPYYSVLDRFLDMVNKHPDKPYIIFEHKTYTYRDVDKQSNKVARVLMEHVGVKRDDVVALFLSNEPAFIWFWLGSVKLGCAAAFLNYNIRAKSLLHCFACCGAKVLIVGSEFKSTVEEVLSELREQNVTVYFIDDGSIMPGCINLSGKINQASDEPIPQSQRKDITSKSTAVYIYTSGTTGLPKAAIINHARLWLGACVLGSIGVNSKDVVYVNLPMYHSAGFMLGFNGATAEGATVILRRKFSASQFWDDCRKYNVTVIQYIGEVLRYLCNVPKKDNDRDHMVRLAIGNGARPEVWKEFLNRFGKIVVREFYGATEGNIGFVNYTNKIGAVGRQFFLHKLAASYAIIKYDSEKEEPIRNSQGLCIPAARGEPGLLVCKISSMSPFSGYVKNEKQTEKKKLKNVFRKGDLYFNSGDLLKVDKDNFIYFNDRLGETFRWKGENVATTEVSDILSMVDCFEEANAYGVSVPGNEGRIGMAAIKLREGKEFESNKVCKHVMSHLPGYARPRFLRIQNSLEITGTFKQMKGKLVKEGFNPATIQDPLYFLDESTKNYVPITQEIYNSILSKEMKL
ncbi:long-chain fatty acid transport protein 2-like [Erpetoichthys calabaricus]|uniref:long-chain-fatty-acid--CoA ligase n=1 Tax=Erpetoichthys calabaricus TaxID=27687 RepID=A0A8C4TGA6_ERPCA|nr:long-chain fatty acid transport protein 2-like [Erpetoichthys calabaricus]